MVVISMQILEQRKQETFIDAMEILKQTGKCAILRPTGFGKTTIMCEIAQYYNRVLYIYPTEIAKKAAIANLKGKKVHFWSYSYLGRFHRNLPLLCQCTIGRFDLIIFDEMHHMGAKNVRYVTEYLLNKIDTRKVHILGGTATPRRMDNYDVIDKFFDNHLVHFYGLDNVMEDKLIPDLYYVYTLAGYKLLFRNTIKACLQLSKRNELPENSKKKIDKALRDKMSQVAYMLNAPLIIKEAVDTVYGVAPQYMKFMVFFSTKEVLNIKRHEVLAWFKTAFPGYKLNTCTIHSELLEKQNIEKLKYLTYRPNTIDLIFSINMLNEGYHIDNITGCILLRPTRSQSVYIQQVGRCMQVGMEYSPIIIDFVDNLNTQALFGETSEFSGNDGSDGSGGLGDQRKLSTQLNRLNYVSKEHIRLVNKIAEAQKVIHKLDGRLPTNKELLVLGKRQEQMPASIIAKELNMPLWEVLRVLHNHSDELKELGLEIQEADRYLRGGVKEEKQIPDFDKHLQELLREQG